MGSKLADPITQLLLRWNAGEEGCFNRLIPLVDKELRRIAHRHMRNERPGHTLQTIALVNEAYRKLVDPSRANWQNRAQFLGVAAGLMRHILVDYARTRRRGKRGGVAPRPPLPRSSRRSNALGVHPNTVIRDWSLARAWLKRELSREVGDAT
jgi:RNA polymerase sigma factor (TIGR02999 family)